jgi:hypothetical protein
VIKESTEEVAGKEAKSALEEGRKHHNLSRIGCRNVFPGSRTSLQNCAGQEKMIHDKLAGQGPLGGTRYGTYAAKWTYGTHMSVLDVQT